MEIYNILVVSKICSNKVHIGSSILKSFTNIGMAVTYMKSKINKIFEKEKSEGDRVEILENNIDNKHYLLNYTHSTCMIFSIETTELI